MTLLRIGNDMRDDLDTITEKVDDLLKEFTLDNEPLVVTKVPDTVTKVSIYDKYPSKYKIPLYKFVMYYSHKPINEIVALARIAMSEGRVVETKSTDLRSFRRTVAKYITRIKYAREHDDKDL